MVQVALLVSIEILKGLVCTVQDRRLRIVSVELVDFGGGTVS